MTPRLAAIDLDGTLLRSDGTASGRTRRALGRARDAGVAIVLASARSPRSVREVAADLGLAGLAVCANGATTYDLDGARIVRHRPFPAEVGQRLGRALRSRVPSACFGWEVELRFGSDSAWEAERTPEWPRPENAFTVCELDEFGEPLTKLIVRARDVPIAELLETVRGLCGTEVAASLAGERFVEVTAAGVGKDAALAEVCAWLGLDVDDTVAFGDHLVDVPMLEWAGWGVATANAHPAALAAADEVTTSNDDDGVAVVLERLLDDTATRGERGSGSDPEVSADLRA